MPCNMPFSETSDSDNSRRIAALEEAMCDVAHFLLVSHTTTKDSTENLRRWYDKHTRQPGCTRKPPDINFPDGPMQCPYCKSEKIKMSYVPLVSAICEGCLMRGPSKEREVDAIQAWNKLARHWE